MDLATIEPAQISEATASATVRLLTGIWSRMLQQPKVSPDADFFDLGGDSLLALNVLLEVERETGLSLPVTTIYDAPTIAELAALIDSPDSSEPSPLVCLKAGEGEPPLFLVHGMGGTALQLSKLAKHLDYNGPVFGFQPKGFDGTSAPLRKVEDIAAYYLAAVREKYPNGPYLFGGFSFGGLVAMEMARLLQRQSGENAFLVLIDSYAHQQTWPRMAKILSWASRAKRRRAAMARQPLSEQVSYLADKLTRRSKEGARFPNYSSVQQFSPWAGQSAADIPAAMKESFEAEEAARVAYAPSRFAGKVVFVKAADAEFGFPPDPRPVWRSLSRELEIHCAPGNHLTMLTEHAAATAAKLSQVLSTAHVRVDDVSARSDALISFGIPLVTIRC